MITPEYISLQIPIYNSNVVFLFYRREVDKDVLEDILNNTYSSHTAVFQVLSTIDEIVNGDSKVIKCVGNNYFVFVWSYTLDGDNVPIIATLSRVVYDLVCQIFRTMGIHHTEDSEVAFGLLVEYITQNVLLCRMNTNSVSNSDERSIKD